jgi:hypothetical protein
MTTTQDRDELLARISVSVTENEIQPLVREWLRGNYGQLTGAIVPAWYEHDFDSKLNYDRFVALRMVLFCDDIWGIALYISEK